MLPRGGTLELIEKILDEDDAMIGVSLLDWQQRDDPPVGRRVEVSPLTDVGEPPLSPGLRLAGDEGLAVHRVRDRHHAVVISAVEQFLPRALPCWVDAAAIRDLPLAAPVGIRAQEDLTRSR